MGYGDVVLRGIQTVRRDAQDVDIRVYMPESIEEGEDIFYKWAASDTQSQQSLFVVTADDYEDMMIKYFRSNHLSEGKEILLFESENLFDLPIYNFTISTYGASYLAGITAAYVSQCPPLIVWGNYMDMSTDCAVVGFQDGYHSQTSSDVEAILLSDDWTGYTMDNEVYYSMSEWVKQYGFIYPIAGGSNNGVYRYLREFPVETYTAGFDIDCSHLSSNVVGSTVKYIDWLLITYIEQWLESGTMPKQSVYGLESGYVDWVLAPDYRSGYRSIMARKRDEAIELEREYETGL